VTEADWLACTGPERMLESLRGKVTDRKLRLFACACCRLVPHLLSDRRSQRAVEVAERFADGLAGRQELSEAHQAAARAHFSAAWRASQAEAWAAASRASLFAARGAAYPAAKRVARRERREKVAAAANLPTAWQAARDTVMGAARAEQAALLREVVGNPFRPVAVEPSSLSWDGGTVIQLSQAVYDDRAFDRLPILADALEDAGCSDAGILAHCRGRGPHVRGCWVVDLLLGQT
jgi:hypothetical protein